MVKQIKSFRLMGRTITVIEKFEGEFESQRKFIDENRHLFKFRKSIEKPRPNRHLFKFPSKVIQAIKSEGGTNFRLLMVKKLEESDVNRYQNRIYVPKNRALLGYLTEYEKQSIERQGKEGGLGVRAIDSRAETYNLNLKMWPGCGSNKYVLIKAWASLVRDNGLEKEDLVEIWCYRVNSKLHLAVNAVKRVDSELRLGLGVGVLMLRS